MQADPYTDTILGQWTPSKNTKDKFCFRRSAKLKLHKDHAQDYLEPKTLKKQRVHGDVVISETKLIDKQTSRVDLFRNLELTETSVVIDVII